MAKYSFEFKRKIVNEYLKGKAGYWTLSATYGMITFSSCTVKFTYCSERKITCQGLTLILHPVLINK